MLLRILIVDDSPAMRGFLRRTIFLSGIEVEEILEAANGQEALDLLSMREVDIILCDVNMPVMNGEAFLEQMHIAGSTESVAVVVVSSDTTIHRKERMLALGARGYVQKPFTPESMRDALGSVLPHLNVGDAA